MREAVFVRNNDFNLFDFKNNGRKHTDFFSRFSSPELELSISQPF